MGNCEAHYRYAVRAAAQTAALCRDLQNGRAPSREAVRRDRVQAITARRALAEELYEAFVTPLDREDLFWLCETAAETLYETQRIALTSATVSQAVWSTVCAVADGLYQAAEAFADGTPSAFFGAVTGLYRRIAEVDRYAGASDHAALDDWLRCCRQTARCMTAALLKNA